MIGLYRPLDQIRHSMLYNNMVFRSGAVGCTVGGPFHNSVGPSYNPMFEVIHIGALFLFLSFIVVLLHYFFIPFLSSLRGVGQHFFECGRSSDDSRFLQESVMFQHLLS